MSAIIRVNLSPESDATSSPEHSEVCRLLEFWQSLIPGYRRSDSIGERHLQTDALADLHWLAVHPEGHPFPA